MTKSKGPRTEILGTPQEKIYKGERLLSHLTWISEVEQSHEY